MSLCQCKEGSKRHHVEGVVWFDYAPLDSGRHTAFILLRCKECGGFCGFPDKDFNLAVREGNAWTHAALLSEGVPKEDLVSLEPQALDRAEPQIVDMAPRMIWEG